VGVVGITSGQKNMINPWFKFYGSEYLSDPKIGSLNAQERSCWITLLCLASTSSTGGLVEYLTTEVLLEKSGIRMNQYDTGDWEKCLGILKKFEEMRMITINKNGSIEITNWSKRQESAMTATERSRKYREKTRVYSENATDATKCNKNATLEENRIEKNRKEYTNKGEKLPDWIDKEIWADWVQHRVEKKKPLTPLSIKKQIKFLEPLKDIHREILNKSIQNGWTGIFDPNEKKGRGKSFSIIN
jgi:hypothetical protein